MAERWVLYKVQGGTPGDVQYEQVAKITPKFVYWTGPRGQSLRIMRGQVVGYYGSFDQAADAQAAVRYAYRRAQEAGEPALIWAKTAAKESPGYIDAEQISLERLHQLDPAGT